MKEKILITVKTYPTLSRKYAELVCTAGVNGKGAWRRIYPVRFRRLLDSKKYKKYQWIEADIEKSSADNRPESYSIAYEESLKILGDPLSTGQKWQARKEAFFDKVTQHNDLSGLIVGAHENKRSLALFQPSKWLDFRVEPVGRHWDPEKLAILDAQRRQLSLFEDEQTVADALKVVKKLPYKFSYRFRDIHGKESTLMIEDWEIGALYWNCLKNSHGDEAAAIAKVKQKYWDDFTQSGRYDLSLILGTTLAHHNRKAPNPFVIIGVVPFPFNPQQSLF